MRFVTGDAQRLDEVLAGCVPAERLDASSPKVVMCVGNTLGIMPDEVKVNVYEQVCVVVL